MLNGENSFPFIIEAMSIAGGDHPETKLGNEPSAMDIAAALKSKQTQSTSNSAVSWHG